METEKDLDIIHIDKDQHFLDIYQEYFSKHGLKSQTYTDSERGFRSAKENNPKVILQELVLADTEGYDLLERFKENGETSYLPVVVLSELGEKRDVEKAREYGANQYIVKQHIKPANVAKCLQQNFIN
ncbi:MAG: PleD family two-component system response regulator [Candidatus Paceibacteria bacterium]